MSEWLKERGCKPCGSAYAGSNPAPPIALACLRARSACDRRTRQRARVLRGFSFRSGWVPALLVGAGSDSEAKVARPRYCSLPDATGDPAALEALRGSEGWTRPAAAAHVGETLGAGPADFRFDNSEGKRRGRWAETTDPTRERRTDVEVRRTVSTAAVPSRSNVVTSTSRLGPRPHQGP